MWKASGSSLDVCVPKHVMARTKQVPVTLRTQSFIFLFCIVFSPCVVHHQIDTKEASFHSYEFLSIRSVPLYKYLTAFVGPFKNKSGW